MNSGIYKISFKGGSGYYIGRTNHFRRRMVNHIYHLNKGTHCNAILTKCWSKYGEENFVFERVIACPAEYCSKLEQWFLDKKPSYNISYNSNGGDNLKLSNEDVDEIRDLFLSKTKSKFEIAEEFDISAEYIVTIGRGTRYSHIPLTAKQREMLLANHPAPFKKRKLTDIEKSEIKYLLGKFTKASIFKKYKTSHRGVDLVEKSKIRKIAPKDTSGLKPNKRVNKDLIPSIKWLCDQGHTHRSIGDLFGETERSVFEIGARISYKEIAPAKPEGLFILPKRKMRRKQSAESIREIRWLYRNGFSVTDIAKQYDVGMSSVSNIHTGKSYGHIKGVSEPLSVENFRRRKGKIKVA